MSFDSRVSILASLVEAGTGLLLLAVPQVFAKLLFGAEVSGAGLAVGRVCGLGLLSLGVACWPGIPALRGLLLYNVLITLYLLYLTVDGELRGVLLVPALILHAVLTVLLLRTYLSRNRSAPKGSGS